MRRTFHRWAPALTGAALLLIVCPTAGAVSLSGRQKRAVEAVEVKANSLPPALTAAMASRDRAALQPAVNAVIASGRPAVRYLVRTTKNPNVMAAIMRRIPPKIVVTRTHPSRVPLNAGRSKHGGVLAHSASCWGAESSQYDFTEAGDVTAWIYTRIDGWCGNGSSITWYGGATFSSWTWGTFCLANNNTDFSWDVPFSWIHAGHWASYGLSYAFGCGTWLSGHAVVRIAANGYWDRYDDYGI